MGYFKVDDILLSHWRAKVAGPAGVGIWTMGGLYCATNLTDGHIPHVVATTLLPSPATAIKKVLEAGLWLPCEEHAKCYVMRAYHADSSGSERQPTRAEVEARRQAARDKKRGQRRGTSGRYAGGTPPIEDGTGPEGVPRGQTGDNAGTTEGVPPSLSNPLLPLPSEEVGRASAPTTEPTSKTRKAVTLPASWKPNDGHRVFAAEQQLDLDSEVVKFRDHHLHRGTLGKDWDAGFRTWLRKAVEYRLKNQEATPTAKSIRERYAERGL